MSRHIVKRHMFLEAVLGEETSNQEVDEVEHVYYGRISDPNQLDELAKQSFVTKALQEQYQIKIDPGNNTNVTTTVRCRKVNTDGFVLTSKKWVKGVQGVKEKSIEVIEDVFDFMKFMAAEGIIKMRYTIQPEGWERKLELDVFLSATGSATGYAKFDYEVSSEEDKVPALPITLVDLKHFNPFTGTDEEAAALKAFMMSQSIRV